MNAASLSAFDYPDYLRTYGENKILAVEAARSTFAAGSVRDAAVMPNGDLVLLSGDGTFIGAMDEYTSGMFGAQA